MGLFKSKSDTPPSKKKPRSRRIKLLFVSATIFLVCIFILEAALRIIYSPSYEFINIFRLDDYRLLSLKPGSRAQPKVAMIVSRFDKDDLGSYSVRINNQGFRGGREYSIKPDPYTLRIICLGDSITFGVGVEEEFTYPRLLEAFLSSKAGGQKAEVINAGCPGYTSRQGLVWFDRELVKYDPHILIVQFGYNDAMYAWKSSPVPFLPKSDSETIKGGPGAWQPVKRDIFSYLGLLLRESIIVKLIKIEYTTYEVKRDSIMVSSQIKNHDRATPSKEENARPEKRRVTVSEYKKNLLDLYRLCAERNIKFVLVDSWPTAYQYRKALAEIAEETGVPLISQYNIIERVRTNPEFVTTQDRFKPMLEKVKERLGDQYLKEKPEYRLVVDYVHPNAIGNILFVEELVRGIN